MIFLTLSGIKNFGSSPATSAARKSVDEISSWVTGCTYMRPPGCAASRAASALRRSQQQLPERAGGRRAPPGPVRDDDVRERRAARASDATSASRETHPCRATDTTSGAEIPRGSSPAYRRYRTAPRAASSRSSATNFGSPRIAAFTSLQAQLAVRHRRVAMRRVRARHEMHARELRASARPRAPCAGVRSESGRKSRRRCRSAPCAQRSSHLRARLRAAVASSRRTQHRDQQVRERAPRLGREHALERRVDSARLP